MSTPLRQIGYGQCGQVWSLGGTPYVLKTPQKGKKDQLFNDFCRHHQVQAAFAQVPFELREHINLTQCEAWIHPTSDQFWRGFSAVNSDPTYGLISTRIEPVPVWVRGAIVNNLAPKTTKKSVLLAEPANHDCLVRLYLGRRGHRTLKSGEFRLRNFPLEVDDMEILGLDTSLYARVMAHSLAALHWKARVDANDVEFVLGSNPLIARRAPVSWQQYEELGLDDCKISSPKVDLCRSSVAIWLLDYNQCKKFGEDEAGLKLLQKGFYFNDPYYPTPISDHPKDKELWEVFKSSYLYASRILTNSTMPSQFIERVESEGRRRKGAVSGGSLFG